jgi:hypothetical protein
MKRTLFLLALVAGAQPAAWCQEPPRAALVPLDDRPSTLLFPRQVGRIGGAEVLTPPRYLLGRWLEPGDPSAVGRWLQQTAPSCERAIVFTDMLCYGGLVASRNAATGLQDALERVHTLENVTGPIDLVATLPRLTLRTSDEQAPYQQAIAAWATQPGAPAPPEIPARFIQEYLEVRQRNLKVLLALIDEVAAGHAQRLVIGQDDSAPTGLHRQEQAILRQTIADKKLESRVQLISGADELAMDMVAGWLAARSNVHPRVRVIYSDPKAGSSIPPLESLPLDTMVRDHLLLAGALPIDDEAVESEQDVQLMIQTPLQHPFVLQPPLSEEPAISAFGRTIQLALDNHHRVAVADLALVNRMDPYLAQTIIGQVQLWRLKGFAGWNTAANGLGTSVAQLVAHQVAHYEGRHWPAERILESEKTHQAFLLARLVDDYGYQTILRQQIAPEAAGLSPTADPLLNLFGPVGLDVRTRLKQWAEQLFAQQFAGRRVWIENLGHWGTLRKLHLEVVLPWPRTFEVEVRLDLRLELVPGDSIPPDRQRNDLGPRG